jgi:exonuclease III
MKNKVKIKSFKLLYYNHCYGTGAIKFWHFFLCHFWHFLGFLEKVRIMSDIEPTVRLIRKHNPDVAVVSEVLGSVQRKELIESFKALGYQYFSIGQGHGWKGSNEKVEILLISKFCIEECKTPQYSVPDRAGYGGGMGSVYIPEMEASLLFVHLPQSDKKAFADQLSIIQNIVDKNKEGLVIAGDFNITRDRLPVSLQKLTPLSLAEPTCSATSFISWWYHKNIDHLLGRGFVLGKSETVEWDSDHRALISTIVASRII